MKATIEINSDSPNASAKFEVDGKTANYRDLTYEEQVKVLNALADFYTLFKKFLKEEE